MAGLLATTLREPEPEREPLPEAQDVDIGETLLANSDKPNVVVDFPDGSVTVTLNAGQKEAAPLDKSKFDQNLAEALDETYLNVLADELLRGIEDDDLSRQNWLSQRAEGIKLLALEIEKPSSGGSGASAGVDNTSRSRHTLLLEAALRFQANARSELLPTDGPVKVESATGDDTVADDELGQLLEDDFNYYLTNTASEYYPDTDRMLLWTGVGGSGFKKVYRCPIRRRPVSESVDAENIIVSNGATDLMNADRVTFKTTLRQSTMKRMQYLGVYRDIAIENPSAQPKSEVEEEKENVTGVVQTQRAEDMPHTIYECYCMIDVRGDEHMEGDKKTGLPRPYKVGIDVSSRQILEVRRNWRQDDEMERPREVFVKFPFVPGFGFYDLGLIQIAGNPTVAATALLRIMIDSGIFGNFPGGLVAKGSDKQNTTDISAPPGGFAPIDVSMIPDGDIRKAAMPLPYKEAGPGIMALFQKIVEDGSRVAGVAEISVGEGRQDAPVGTTIALIEQATKPIDAVHKRLHAAQSKEFSLLRELFIEYPEDFYRFNKKRNPRWDAEKLTKALTDFDLVPKADPNTSSHLQRILRAQALYQMANAHPEIYNVPEVQEYVLREGLNIRNADSFINSNPQGQQPDPKAQASLIGAQADLQDSQTKAADLAFKMKNAATEDQNRDLDRQADVHIADTKLRTEQVIHAQATQADLASQASAQQHERVMQNADLQGEQQVRAQDGAQHLTGLVSDHAMQAKDHLHQRALGALKEQKGPKA